MRWQFKASSSALQTRVGQREDTTIKVDSWRGCALYGPHLSMPAGRLTARLMLAPGGRGRIRLELVADGARVRLWSETVRVNGQVTITRTLELADEVDGLELRLFCRGPTRLAIRGLELELARDHVWATPEPSRAVGYESGKSYADKIRSGFVDRYLSGPAVMEVGYKGYGHKTVPIVPQAVGVDVGYPGYEHSRFPFADASLDAIYSSHCFEHIPDYRAVLRDWHRLLKVGGFLIIVVPHQHLFERKRDMPSRWNPDHQRFYTPRSLLAELEAALDENSYRIRHLVENDAGFDYARTPREGGVGCYEIELVVEKIALPGWVMDNGTVRPYTPADFHFRPGQQRRSPYEAELDLGETGCLSWGPYNWLGPGRYAADFFFDAADAGAGEARLTLDVARDAARIASVDARLDSGTSRHRVTLPFTTERDGVFEFRVANDAAQPGRELLFRGVELRHATDG